MADEANTTDQSMIIAAGFQCQRVVSRTDLQFTKVTIVTCKVGETTVRYAVNHATGKVSLVTPE